MRRIPGSLVAVAGALWLVACMAKGEPANDAAQPGAAQQITQTPSLSALLDSLRNIELKVVDRPTGSWAIEDGMALFGEFVKHRDSAVVTLVECIGDTTVSRSTYRGSPVMFGFMCYSALKMVAYTEVDDSGDWAGSIMPGADARRLRAGQEAWRAVLAQGRYRLN